MAEAVFGGPAVSVLATSFTRHYYPVLGVLNGPSGDKSPLTPYGRQVARSIIRYFRGGPSETTGPSGWDSGGAGRVPRWQTESYERVDDIPRRKAVQQKPTTADDLSPRSKSGELTGEGLLAPRWIDKQQQRPATVMSLHSLPPHAEDDVAGLVAIGEEMARNRVCLAAYGLTYAAVVIVSRAQADEPQVEARLGALLQRGGLEASQFFVCRPSNAQQQQQAFQAFLGDLERRLYVRACAFYAAAFMRTQAKLVAIPQLPLPPRPSDTALGLVGAGSAAQAVFKEPGLVSRYSRFLPLRAWMVRYHFKLAVFAECGGDRDTAQRCMWLAYAHLLSYVGEIAAGAYLPTTDGPDHGLQPGWLWDFNGGDADGSRARSLRMFGPRWDEAILLLDAVHVRVVRGWLYQALDAAALHSSAETQLRPPPITPISRSGPRAAPAANSTTTSPLAASFSESLTSAGGNGSLDHLIFSVHAGECSAATEQLMDMERGRRRLQAKDPMYYLALGSETADVDLLQPVASDTCGWWPLGGQYAVVDFSGSSSGSRLRPTGFDGASRLGLVINSSLDAGAMASHLPQTSQYDAHLTLAARQCAQHVVSLAQVLTLAGFGGDSSYFWATVGRQYTSHAALYVVASANGVDFGRAFDGSLDVPQLSSVVDSVVATLRRPRTANAGKVISAPPVAGRPVRPRAPSTAFTGFAFDQALGGIYAVVGPKDKTVASDSVPTAASTGGTLFPLWMWPRTASALFQAASFASLQRHRRLAAEDKAYYSSNKHQLASEPSDVEARVFSANPGVENTYASVWLAAERKRQVDEPGAALASTTRLLAAALACLHPSAAIDGESGVDSLVRFISDSAPDSSVHQHLCLASELAEVYAESGQNQNALSIFQALAGRFRAEGWEALTRHALQWVSRCASSVDDKRAMLTAAIELLSSQQDAVSDIDVLLSDVTFVDVEVDMTQIYSPIACHAHWRHWRLPEDVQKMAFQVELDCQHLVRPLKLSELCVEFSDPRYSVRLGHDEEQVLPELVDGVGFYDVRGQGKCNLEMRPGSAVVFEGCVEIESFESVACALVLVGVSAVVAGSSAKLRLNWPTCAQASAQTAALSDGSEQGFSHMEALLAASAAVARAHDPLLRQTSLEKSHVAAASYSEHVALRRAVTVSGPTSAVPSNRRWLVVYSTSRRWHSLPSPPLLPQSAQQDEPGFSAYSRCRVLGLPMVAEAGLVVSMPQVGALAPAYRGEAFAVEIVVRNMHTRLAALGVAVDVRLAGLETSVTDSMSELNVGSAEGNDASDEEVSTGAISDAPWLSAAGEAGGRELLGMLPGTKDLMPGESRSLTVFVNFPATQLSSANRSTATDVAVVHCSVRYTTDSSSSVIEVLAQASIPVARPLYASAKLLPSHVAAPEAPRTASGLDANSAGEFCFRRPVLVTLHNAGPWDVIVDNVVLHPPSAEALSQALGAAGAAPMSVKVAGSTAITGTLAAGGSLKHVFWIDIVASDLVRLSADVCPGVLHVEWRRHSSQTYTARMWMPAMRLITRRLLVENMCSGVARVGEALALSYRVTNATRRTRTVDIAMHATEAFVFAGPRRLALTVLPGHAAMLRFNLLPVTAVAPPGSAFAPGFAVLQAKEPGNATGHGWVLLPRLEIKPVAALPVSSPSNASSQLAAPPPTRAAPSAVQLGSVTSDVHEPSAILVRAQRTIAALAGVDDNAQRPMTPGLAEQSIDVLPPCLVYGTASGAESDFEDSDDEQVAGAHDSDDEEIAVKRLAIPSTVILGVACTFFLCVVIISRSAIHARQKYFSGPDSLTSPYGRPSVEDNIDAYLFDWKRRVDAKPMGPLRETDAVGDKLSPSDDEKLTSQRIYVPLVRLEGWPTEFPENLTEYRQEVLESEWASDVEKHVAEIAPWVWHHRGDADILQSLALSNDPLVAERAQRDMARRKILPNYDVQANASFVVLIRNREMNEFRATMRQLEDRFNGKYHYPYLFLNDEPFTDEFMQTIAASTTSNVTFALIPQDHWSVPDFVDESRALAARQQMAANNVIYGGSLSYRHMCRFNSGFFYKHPLLQSVDWYWRVEPGVDFYCDLDYDPFKYMEDNGKLYSFVIALKELELTIPSLWDHTLEYMLVNNITSNLMSYFVTETGGYNLCHFWSNFEIASLNWLRSPAYDSFFQALDRAGGFFMERWGDAPVHSIAAGMLLNYEQRRKLPTAMEIL
ncbi:hypothetical protein GGI17_003279 [Coemansia sp. S146]|nr:hypothetical protein GGI17_003279 [Coemansia sp. S146]